MKKLIPFTLIAAVLMVTAIGCSDILQTPQQKENADTSGVEVSIGSGARTLLPGANLLYYTLSFTSEGKEPVTRSLNGAASLSVALEPGTWTLNVTGYLNAENAAAATNAVAEGSAAVTVNAGRTTPVTVELRAIQEASGTGTLNYVVNFPDQVEKATLKLVPITGAGGSQTLTLKDGDTVNKSGSQDGLAAGYYRIILGLSYYDGDAGLTKQAEKSQIAHIYAGLETDLAETFGEDAFSGVPTFTSVEALGAYLAAADQNSKNDPYSVALRGLDLSADLTQGLDPLGKLFNALNGRFVYLDLSACTGDFSDADFTAVSNRINRFQLVSLVLPSTVSRIGNILFYNCQGLKSVLWPEAPVDAAIGDSAFENTSSLERVTLPSALKTIGTYGFAGTALVSLDLPGALESIATFAFYECPFLESVNWPEAPEGATLGGGVFYECRRLRSVKLPPTLTVISESAFYNCVSLESVNLPRDLTSIGNYAFQSCRSLTSAEIPAGIIGQNLGIGAFTGCVSLKSVTLPEGLTWLYTNTFSNAPLETITLPASLININGTPFTGCANLRFTVAEGNTVFSTAADGMVLILKSEEIIRIVAAAGASGEITIPEGVTHIFESAFQNAVSLTKVSLPSTLIDIGQYAFSGSGIREITIPPSVTTISYYAFSNCYALEEVSWPTCSETLPISAYYSFQGCSSLASVTLPEGLKSIGPYMFDGCSSLRSIDLPGGITSIGTYAFRNSALESIELPATLQVINASVFYGCSSLRWVKWPVSPANAYITSSSFTGCTALERIELPDNLRTSSAIPANAFANLSGLKTVVIRTTAVAGLGNVSAFTGTHEDLKIYVPDANVSDYQAGTNWTSLSEKIVSINSLGDENPENWE
jgi:hypothetical protein